MDVKHKIKIGRVLSNKMDKTVVVEIRTVKHHPLYRKTMRRAVKYKAHDEKNACSEGDIVRIVETRPLSREKRWRVEEILSSKEGVDIRPEEIN